VRLHLLFICIVAAALLAACTPSVPSQYIQPDDMEDLLVDIHLAQSMAQEGTDTLPTDYKENLYFAAALAKHGVTKAQFDSSLTYYYIRADRFSDMYKHVAKRLSEQALAQGATEGEVNRFASMLNSSDTTDVWRGQFSAMLIPYPPYNRFDFEQKADTSFREGDSFMFIANTGYIYQSGSRSVQACLVMKYDNDSIISRTASFSSSGINQLRMPRNGDHQVKEIWGYIYMAPEREYSPSLKLMLVKDMQLIKFRNKKDEMPADSTEYKQTDN